jgi:threonylcarbamoyladenosine tRNA methylthiotransferase MtaB
MTFAVHTLGCKTNQAESAEIAAVLAARGHTSVAWSDAADAYIVNTCTVTAAADAKCRAVIRRIRRLHPEAVVAVFGCLSQLKPETVRELGADLVLGTHDRGELPLKLEELWNGTAAAGKTDCATALPRLPGRTRTFMKIQDGCDNSCRYCIIPSARGPSRSVPVEQLLPLLLSLKNCPEVVITGIEISSWGYDLPGHVRLPDCVSALCNARSDIRFRLSSLDPAAVDDAFVSGISGLPNLCPHFHLPLQSGCDATLNRMARRYNTRRYAAALFCLRTAFPDAAVSADLITGFPGEDETEWRQSLSFFESCGFASAHIFPFSRRSGTAAAELPDQNTKEQKKARAGQAAEVAAASARRYAESCIGRVYRVAVEERRASGWTGHAENYCRVFFHAPPSPDLRGQCVGVEIVGCEGADLVGVLV